MLKIRKKDWIEIVLHIAFWVGVFYTLLSFTQPHIKMRINHNGTILDEDITHSFSPHIFVTLGFMIVLFYTNIFWLLRKALRYRNMLVRVALPITLFGIIFLAASYIDAWLPPPIRTDTILMPAFPPDKQHVTKDTARESVVRINIRANDNKADSTRRPDRAKLGGLIKPDIVEREVARQQSRNFVFATDGFSNILLFIFIIIFGLSIAYFFLKEWARVEKMRSDLAAVQLDTEVKFLKSQVNPHFLFNTLNNLFSMAQKKGNDSLADGISKLSGMMRYMIYESNEEKVPLKKEIEYLQDCISLNKLRYADKEAVVKFDFPSDTEGVIIAPMLFISFVENAFKHGVMIGKSSEIDISISVTNKQLTFTCRNTAYDVKKMAENSGIGLENVKRRLQLVYPGKHQLRIEEKDGKYMVNLEIDLA
jgi:two-component system LytT family sensor kinase